MDNEIVDGSGVLVGPGHEVLAQAQQPHKNQNHHAQDGVDQIAQADPAGFDRAIQGRASENLTAWVMVTQHPLLGVGLNNFASLYQDYTKSLQRLKMMRDIEGTKLFMAHDEKNECSVGDLVMIAETRPMSKNKRWRVVEVLERAK